jgi:hypothetical protein
MTTKIWRRPASHQQFLKAVQGLRSINQLFSEETKHWVVEDSFGAICCLCEAEPDEAPQKLRVLKEAFSDPNLIFRQVTENEFQDILRTCRNPYECSDVELKNMPRKPRREIA